MARYLISFDDGAMTFPEEELSAVADAAHSVMHEAKNAGVWVFGGGLTALEEAIVVDTDGTVTDGTFSENRQYLGGFSIVDVPSREEAVKWAAKFAVACRCAQELREVLPDPLSDPRAPPTLPA
ncbi:MAG: YciI family protein [Candidatus Dormiibacterota bacterium]